MAYTGEIRLAAFTTPPKNWVPCEGQLLLIAQNQVLYSLFGTAYGGNGQTNFALPDLRGRVAIHPSRDFPFATPGGEESHALTVAEIPSHTHSLSVSSAPATTADPNAAVMATPPSTLGDVYGNATQQAAMAPSAVGPSGGGVGHQNMQPYVVLSFFICLNGVFPSPSSNSEEGD